MKIQDLSWKSGAWHKVSNAIDNNDSVKFVIYFGDAESFLSAKPFNDLKNLYKNAIIIGASGGGIIEADFFLDSGLTACAVSFDDSFVKMHSYDIASASESEQIAQQVFNDLDKNNLKGVMVITDGLNFNGTLFTRSLTKNLGSSIPIVGGMASDGANFKQTFVCANDVPKQNKVVVVAFYGKVKVLYGSDGGWEDFGPVRKITKSAGNVLYELDNKPALELYKTYLGKEAQNLPASGLLFPLAIFEENAQHLAVTRTIIGIDEEKQSLIFAGDIPQNWFAKLMHTDNAGLAKGAKSAAIQTSASEASDSLAVLVSCIGRRLFMGPVIEDEIAAVGGVLKKSHILGFYSNGEICPILKNGASDLHNQTMTISVLVE